MNADPPSKISGRAEEILYSSAEVHDAIKEILVAPKPGDRRVVLVAFLSAQSEAFLPDPEGLEIVCWLRPGSTDPMALERLKRRGAKIFKSENLHMKIYWSSRKGCIICSANLSGNALGNGGQKEAGIKLPPGVVDINRLWEYAAPDEIGPKDLKRLNIENDMIGANGAELCATEPPDFAEWLKLSSRRDWKLGWWCEEAKFAERALLQSRKSYGVDEPCDFLNIGQEQLKTGDWVLTFRLPHGASVGWMHVDFVVAVDRSDRAAFDKEYPFQAVQVKSLKYHPRPPFKIDLDFRRAFKKAIKMYGEDRIEDLRTLRPPKAFIKEIAAYFQYGKRD